jgi:uncharacterized membrane protein YedE/YeeE
MPAILAALVSGLLFGLGLTVSQMVNPAKVIAFIDIFGDWDPSLAFVMAAAIPLAAVSFWVGARRAAPLCADRFSPPVQAKVDRSLILGAVLFGVGWGLVGYCPGPALAALPLGNSRTWLFVVAMLVGMGAHRGWRAAAQRASRALAEKAAPVLDRRRPVSRAGQSVCEPVAVAFRDKRATPARSSPIAQNPLTSSVTEMPLPQLRVP